MVHNIFKMNAIITVFITFRIVTYNLPSFFLCLEILEKKPSVNICFETANVNITKLNIDRWQRIDTIFNMIHSENKDNIRSTRLKT